MENDVCEDSVCSVYVWWWLTVRESILGVCSELCLFCCSLYLVRVLNVVLWEGGLSLVRVLCARLSSCHN